MLDNAGADHFELFLGLSKTDKDFLEKIKNTLKSNAPIRDYLIKNSKRNSNWNDTWTSQFYITSKKIFNDLSRFNIIPRKSLIYTFPEWIAKHELKNHFMRGYSDGDGSFYKSINGKGQLYYSLRGTSEFLKIYRSILEVECNLNKRSKDIRISSNCGILEYGGNILVGKLINFLYKDATIFLPRKYNIAKSIID